MKVLITGADGFIGKNLQLFLRNRDDVDVVCFGRNDDVSNLPVLLRDVNFVFHLAGVNRSQNHNDFIDGNQNLTQIIVDSVVDAGIKANHCPAKIVYASSIHAGNESSYGVSKLGAEKVLLSIATMNSIPVCIFRLPNVFGKWCKPNYNSVVATFCYNISRGMPVIVNDEDALVTLVYIDDVIARFIQLMDNKNFVSNTGGFESISPCYTVSVGYLSRKIQAFKNSRKNLITEHVGSGLVRALYSTYVSYLPVESFAYPIKKYEDERGIFVEMLKTPDCGQFSFFTAHPGVTRGGHYHHSKSEKFLVVKGRACFKFRHMQTSEIYELTTSGDAPQVVETVPGWTHDITNIGSDELVVMLWANEIFDQCRPDTFACPV